MVRWIPKSPNGDVKVRRDMDNQFNKEMDTVTGERMKEEIASKSKGIKDKVAEVGRQAVEKIDAQREPAASTLGKTANSLHEQVEKASSVAHATADKLQDTADYVRENDVKAMMDDVEGLVKRYPGQALATAAAVGFLVGRLFQRKE
jgi:ElaB/YqjD/DUF883 family membrane-anchored ribosome-binding protein